MIERFVDRRPLIALALIICAAALMRAAQVYLSDGAIWGSDGWHYVLHSKSLVGSELPDWLRDRPPLAPGYTLLPFIHAFGEIRAVAIYSAAVSICVVPAAYILGRGFLPTRYAIWGAALVGIMFTELTVAFLNGAVVFPAMAVLMLALRILLDWAQGKPMTWQRLALIGGATALMPYLSQIFAGFYVALFLICLPVSTWERGRALGVGLIGAIRSTDAYRLMTALALGGGIAVCAYPWYLDVSPLSQKIPDFYGGNSIFGVIRLIAFSNEVEGVPIRLEPLIPGIHRDSISCIFFIASAVLCWRVRTPKLIPMLLISMGILSVLYSSNETLANFNWRSHPFGEMLMLLALPYIWHRYCGYWQPSALTRAIFVLLVLGMATLSFYISANFDSIPKEKYAAAEQGIITAQDNGYSVGLFLSPWLSHQLYAFSDMGPNLHIISMSEMPIYHIANHYPDAYREPTNSELQKACVLNIRHIIDRFAGGLCEPLDAARDMQITYVVSLDGFDKHLLPHILAAEWLTPIYEREGIIVWAIE